MLCHPVPMSKSIVATFGIILDNKQACQLSHIKEVTIQVNQTCATSITQFIGIMTLAPLL